MDIESKNRKVIRTALESAFEIWEEVWIASPQGRLRVDLVAVWKGGLLQGAAIGFEVKAPNNAMNFQNWAKVFKQAADYVNAKTIDKRLPEVSLSAVFVYPSPPYVPNHMHSGLEQPKNEGWYRNEQLLQYAGVIHLAQHFRVGSAGIRAMGEDQLFVLSMGPNPVWDQSFGWHKTGIDLINSKRIGSQVKSVEIPNSKISF